MTIQMQPISTGPRGSAVDFDQIYGREFGYVWNSLRRLGIRDRDLPDVTQEVFLRVFTALSSFDGSRPLRPWLFGVALRTASNHRRLWRHERETLQHTPIDMEDPGLSPEDQAAATSDRRLVMSALQEVRIERRAVLVLHEIDGLPIPQVAEALGVPENTAYSRLRRGLVDLSNALERLGKEGR